MRTSNFAIKAYIVAVLTLFLGVVLSLNLHDWSWFARSGSLVVINGIILTSHQIIEHMGRLKQRQAKWENSARRSGNRSSTMTGLRMTNTV